MLPRRTLSSAPAPPSLEGKGDRECSAGTDSADAPEAASVRAGHRSRPKGTKAGVMTAQESFKRRIRERMAKTGERYGAARRALIPPPDPSRRVWVSEPEMSDESVRRATGRGWDEWCDAIESWQRGRGARRDEPHAAIVAFVQERGVDGWWSQTVAVGYERIVGRRLKHQRADGTFEVSTSRTMHLDAAALRSMLLDPAGRVDLFPRWDTTLRSRPTAKALRVGIGPGVALFALDGIPDGRVRVTVAHSGLPSPEQVAEWKAYWSDWLAAIDLG